MHESDRAQNGSDETEPDSEKHLGLGLRMRIHLASLQLLLESVLSKFLVHLAWCLQLHISNFTTLVEMAHKPMLFVPMIAYQLRSLSRVDWLSKTDINSKETKELISKSMYSLRTLGLWIAITFSFHHQSSPFATVRLNQLITKTYQNEKVFWIHVVIFKFLPMPNFGAAVSLRSFFSIQRFFHVASRSLSPMMNLFFFEFIDWIWPKRYAFASLIGWIVLKACERMVERFLFLYVLNHLYMLVRGSFLFEEWYWSRPGGFELSILAIDIYRSVLNRFRRSRNRWSTTPGLTTQTPLTPFQYSPIQEKNTIRLLLIYPRHPSGPLNCALFQTPLLSIPRYEAISYRWGGTGPDQEINVNGHSIMVTPNAFEVLQNRSSFWRPRLVWLDSVCIDQSNENEKAEQIELMEDIYRKAYIVTAALVVDLGSLDINKEIRTILGDMAADLWSSMATSPGLIEYRNGIIKHIMVSLAADLLDDLRLSYFQNQADHLSWVKKYAPQRRSWRTKAFRHFLANPWFERMWVVQETALPPSLRILYGNLEIDWKHLVDAVSIIGENAMLSGPLLESGDSVGHRIAAPAACSTIPLMARIRNLMQEEKGVPFGELLLRCRHFTATEPKDKLFAIRGMCTKLPETLLKPTESTKKTWQEVYFNAAECLVAEGDTARMLASCSGVTSSTSPSWVPNWSIRQTETPFSFMHEEGMNYQAGGLQQVEAKIEGQSLFITGIPFDAIMELGPVWDLSQVRTGEFHVSALFDNLPTLFKTSYDMIIWSPWRKEPYPGVENQRMRDAFWRTMIGNRDFKGNPAPDSLARQFEMYEKFLADIREHPEKIRENKEIGKKEQEDMVLTSDFAHPLMRCWGGRRVCISMRGYIGVVPAGTEVGDKIVVLGGMQTPTVLRVVRGKDGVRYRNVGECYVHGLMNGEVFETGIKERDLELI
jgi:hypothetical protein